MPPRKPRNSYPQFDASSQPLSAKLSPYDARVDEMMKQRNPTKVMIFGQNAAGLIAADFSVSRLMRLAEADLDAARAVLLNPTRTNCQMGSLIGSKHTKNILAIL